MKIEHEELKVFLAKSGGGTLFVFLKDTEKEPALSDEEIREIWERNGILQVYDIVQMRLVQSAPGQFASVPLDYEDLDYAEYGTRYFKFENVHSLVFDFNEIGRNTINSIVKGITEKRHLIQPAAGEVPTGEEAEKDVKTRHHQFRGRQQQTEGGIIVP